MDIILNVILPLSLAFIMFSLGLGLSLGDFVRVARMPKPFLAGFACQVILLPLVAFALCLAFGLTGALAVGVMILAFSPGGVTSNLLTRFARGSVALSVSLTGVVSLLSVLTVPILTAAALGYFMAETAPRVDVTSLAVAMFLITTVPVALGIAVRGFAPGFTARIENGTATAAAILFAIIILGALAANWDTFISNIGILGPLLVTLNLAMLAIGFGIARILGLARPEATAIAVEAGVQNGTLGITVGTLLVEGAAGLEPFSLPSGVYGIAMYLVSLPVVAMLRALAPVSSEASATRR